MPPTINLREAAAWDAFLEASRINWDAFLEASIAKAKAEILADVYADRRIPLDVRSFADLHDYVDANEYGGLCDDEWLALWNIDDSDTFHSVANSIQDTLSRWIKDGGLRCSTPRRARRARRRRS